MNFSQIIIKNIKYNIKNYTTFLLGNTIIQCILFMFFMLSCSPEFYDQVNNTSIQANFNSILVLMLSFSIAFIIFTIICFTKYRGKEFGVYFTIGLTSKEILRILALEDIIISLSSSILAVITGGAFSRLFQLAIGNILGLDELNITLSYKTILIMLLIAIFIFLANIIYQFIYLKKYTIIDILKSKKCKNLGKVNSIIGGIATIIFICSLFLFREVFNGEIKDDGNIILICFIGVAISLYFLIGYFMTWVVKFLMRFKKIYNNNILFINSLNYRFKHFNNVLYIISIMVILAITFISAGYSTYKSTENMNNMKYPNDVSFILNYNSYNEENNKKIVEKYLGEMKDYKAIEGINIKDLRVYDDEVFQYYHNILVINEDSYKELTNDDIELNKDQVIYIHDAKRNTFSDSGFILVGDNINIDSKGMSVTEFKEKNKDYIYIDKENRIDKINNLFNFYVDKVYSRNSTLVLNNEEYNKLKSNTSNKTYEILINLKDKGDYDSLREDLKDYYGEDVSNTVTVKDEEFSLAIKENGFMLFIFSFLGVMLLVGSASMLYFKVITSVEEDRERSKQLIKIGLTNKEIDKLLSKELATIFLVPPVIAIGITGYFLKNIYSIVSEGDFMWQNSLVVFLVYTIIQMMFFGLTNNKYKKMIN